ncbi:heme ABC transporter ATP-binding protein [Vulcanimicrobium alpinum]|uniref:Heme ABC transporter ATP-binding protein n=1 Tax=Vulcanimicrobium alpinum TaxID=3016050 RepID=A0AAN2C7D7_UNVUL|nr:ATP-binding cassette domain-containing protein [Vulcanimicrobium alpinum]BDE04875.1 heme ABC transporter ATP-binding protein [Vulcanimicrobium alpinum]
MRRRFGAVQAVAGVDLELVPGEIHALVGENGAGKSTLAAIAYGAVRADEGSVEANGVVGLVHQHFKLIDRLRVWENVLLNREPRRGWQIDVAAARERVRRLGATYGLEVDPDAIVETLPVGIKQRVELLRELDREPAVLLLDEPTAALAPGEIASFFATVQGLAARGTAILVVTHKLAEVIAYSQRVTVMRAGTVVARHLTAQTSAEQIAREMVGGDVPALATRAAVTPRPLLALRDVSAASGTSVLERATFEVGAGEIVGIAGIEGNGQSALADALAGVVRFSGDAAFDGAPLEPGDTPAQRLARGIRVIPQDRRHEALILDWSVRDNVALGRQRSLPLRAFGDAAREVIAAYDVRPPNPDAVAGALSGGNQQKVVVGRALASAPKLVVAYQPTRGVDVGAAALLQSRLIEARNAGAGVLLISFELDEIFACADRVLVIAGGRFVGAFARAEIDRGRIGALMAGGAA